MPFFSQKTHHSFRYHWRRSTIIISALIVISLVFIITSLFYGITGTVTVKKIETLCNNEQQFCVKKVYINNFGTALDVRPEDNVKVGDIVTVKYQCYLKGCRLIDAKIFSQQ